MAYPSRARMQKMFFVPPGPVFYVAPSSNARLSSRGVSICRHSRRVLANRHEKRQSSFLGTFGVRFVAKPICTFRSPSHRSFETTFGIVTTASLSKAFNAVMAFLSRPLRTIMTAAVLAALSLAVLIHKSNVAHAASILPTGLVLPGVVPSLLAALLVAAFGGTALWNLLEKRRIWSSLMDLQKLRLKPSHRNELCPYCVRGLRKDVTTFSCCHRFHSSCLLMAEGSLLDCPVCRDNVDYHPEVIGEHVYSPIFVGALSVLEKRHSDFLEERSKRPDPFPKFKWGWERAWWAEQYWRDEYIPRLDVPASWLHMQRRGAGIHKGISCDVCGTKPIIGTRYKCLQCRNFDLCAICYSADTFLHRKKHTFAAMEKEEKKKEPNPVTSSGSHQSSTDSTTNSTTTDPSIEKDVVSSVVGPIDITLFDLILLDAVLRAPSALSGSGSLGSCESKSEKSSDSDDGSSDDAGGGLSSGSAPSGVDETKS